MKLRTGFVFLACAALVAAGCGGSDDKDSKDTKSAKKPSKAQAAIDKDRDNKEKQVSTAEKAFKKDKTDAASCRNLAMSYVALASPASTGDVKNPPPVPKDRDKNLKKAVSTLEDCTKLDAKDRSIKQMLASVYMATNKYDEASSLNGELAKSASKEEAPNAYYAWGLAASNAQQFDVAVAAWQKFISLAPKVDGKADPRIAQVKQSIKALQAQKKNEATAKAAAATTDASKDSEKSDSDKDA